MHSERLRRIIEAGPCKIDMEQEVLGVADGTINSENTIQQVFAHMAECDSCRYLYEDYFATHDNDGNLLEEGEREETVELGMKLEPGSIVPLAADFMVEGQQAAVLSGEAVSMAEYRVPAGDDTVNVKVYPGDDTVSIHLSTPGDGDRVTLISAGSMETATVEKGIARFENVVPGRVLLVINMRHFVTVKIEK